MTSDIISCSYYSFSILLLDNITNSLDDDVENDCVAKMTLQPMEHNDCGTVEV